MRRLDLSLQELGSARLLVYNGDVNDLDNNINHKNVLTFQRTTFVDVPICYFDLTELVPLAEIQKYTIDKFDLLNMLKITIDVVNYSIKQNRDLKSILFDPEYVYLDGDFNTFFLPLKTNAEGNNYKTFLKNIIVDSVIDPIDNSNYLQLLLNCINDPNFSMDYLTKMVEQIITNKPIDFKSNTRPIRNSTTIKKTVQANEQQNIPFPSFSSQQSQMNQQRQMQPPVPIPDDTHYPTNQFPNSYKKDDYQYNTQRSSSNSLNIGLAYLISEEDHNHKINIDTNIFALGRNPEIVNFPINSPYVGRLHAVIKNENGNYYLIDKNSTNGTYLNGQRLQPEVPQPLNSGDVIRLAKHSFLFNID